MSAIKYGMPRPCTALGGRSYTVGDAAKWNWKRGGISIQSCVVNCQGDKYAAARRETLLSSWNILNTLLAREFVISRLFLYGTLHFKSIFTWQETSCYKISKFMT